MLEPKRIETDIQPQIIEKLGNGTYYYNYDIKSKNIIVDNQEEQVEKTIWTYIQVHLNGVPNHDDCIRGVIKQFVSIDDELALINKYSAYQLGISTDDSICIKYQDYIETLTNIRKNVKKDFE